MTITIHAKPLEVKAELPGYGVFYLRRLGASKEAELQDILNKAAVQIETVSAEFKDIIDRESEYIKNGDDKALTKLRASTAYQNAKEAQSKANDNLQQAVNYANKCQLSLWRAEDPKSIERLLNDFTTKQIIGFYTQVMAEANTDA